jgi:hypothetical protein
VSMRERSGVNASPPVGEAECAARAPGEGFARDTAGAHSPSASGPTRAVTSSPHRPPHPPRDQNGPDRPSLGKGFCGVAGNRNIVNGYPTREYG